MFILTRVRGGERFAIRTEPDRTTTITHLRRYLEQAPTDDRFEVRNVHGCRVLDVWHDAASGRWVDRGPWA